MGVSVRISSVVSDNNRVTDLESIVKCIQCLVCCGALGGRHLPPNVMSYVINAV